MRKIILFIALAITGTCVQAMDFDFNPYIGFDIGSRHMDFSKGYGQKQLRKDYFQGNVFAGVKFNPCVGMELGYSQSQKRKKNALLGPGDAILGGAPLVTGDLDFSENHSQIKGVNLNVMGFYPIIDEIQLLGSVGLARERLKVTIQPTGNETGPITQAAREQTRRDFSHVKYVPLVRVGAQYSWVESFGIRALFGWENTNRFKTMVPKQASAARASALNSFNFSLGLAWQF